MKRPEQRHLARWPQSVQPAAAVANSRRKRPTARTERKRKHRSGSAYTPLKLEVSPHFRIRVISATREITPVLLGNPYRRRNRLWLRGALVKRARARLTRRIRSVDYPGGIAVFRRRPLNSTPRAARRNVQSGPNPSLRPVSQVARPHKHCETAIRHIACSQTVPKVDISKGPESC